ncbi:MULTISPECIES: alanyl-tRNA editing protein [Halorubrum]|uniref:Misacylated tRNA(Ala) deacylase n=1 Tax=Halorubrum sodomense TaxID=35743 RepID=A0A1I6H6P7_HALSD|nr:MULTISPECIES: alanyl-tRNA editing protein [Halorubrum]TKX55746.1 alanyl-tRNA editing protein [Halorubrum sp. SP3]TKX71470.1 alanyl-tRNA editing protein [Halorubrum sp. SP9]SFR50176.1 misacylated tRNA(Ala) deacylase [Halorubrum sodomense]
MTERLYLADDAVTTFEATVERVLSNPDRLVLDRTHFYPTGGGQPHDTGAIRAVDGGGDFRVVDVEMADTVHHEVEPLSEGDDAGDAGEAPALPEPGTDVTCEIDADRREAHSRYHTAQHLLSALLLDEFDAPTTGNQLYHDRARIDVAYDRFTDDDLDRVEARLNDLVDDGRGVSSYTMDRETAEATLDTDRTRIDLLPDSIEELRIVEIAGADGDDDPYDRTACAGTHVANTADIGEVVVTGRETKGPDEERVRFALAEHVDGGE